MMGHRQVEQAALFYEFSLESHVPANHPLGYCFDIRSERRLCEDVHLNPAYRYLIDADNAIIAHLGLQAHSARHALLADLLECGHPVLNVISGRQFAVLNGDHHVSVYRVRGHRSSHPH
jgi:hypothetical protein